MATAVAKGKKIVGDDRAKIGDKIAKAYNKGKSIRQLADENGRSYGFVHNVLSERADVTLRGRGGATRGKAKATRGSTR